jgi:glycosyltransferase involved in cell wall biosynthesis
LAATLDSIFSQNTFPSQFEVLIIDNGSSDETRNIADTFMRKSSRVQYFFEAEPGLHIGRHAGLKHASFENLIFIDDDIHVGENWLTAIEHEFNDPATAMIAGNALPKFLADPPIWINDLWEKTMDNGIKMIWPLSIIEFTHERRMVLPMHVFGCNFPIRKSVLLEAGGFGPDAFPKEKLEYRGDGETRVSRFVKNKGLKCVFNKQVSVFHNVTENRMTLDYFRHRGFAEGISKSYAELRSGIKDRPNNLNKLKHALKRLYRNRKLGSEAREVLKELDHGILAGYAHHQTQYLSDAMLRKWVHKSDYY